MTDYPRVKADSSGRGTFTGQSYGSNQVTRGWFNSEEKAAPPLPSRAPAISKSPSSEKS